MMFSELYSAYYNVMARLLRAASHHPVSPEELRQLVEKHAFGESVMQVEPALRAGRWPLLRPDGTTPLQHPPVMPLTTLQKRWINAIALDPRMKLFMDEAVTFPDVPPLFTPADVGYFDRYQDGDPYGDEGYIRRFRLILDAIRTKTVLRIQCTNRRGQVVRKTLYPSHLEYSEKDDKFRLVGSGSGRGGVVNLGRILHVAPAAEKAVSGMGQRGKPAMQQVTLSLQDERNALERALMHFAHFEKEAEQTGEGAYRITITYDASDETEMVIRILSFGPMVKVIEPPAFVALIRERLIQQKSCGR